MILPQHIQNNWQCITNPPSTQDRQESPIKRRVEDLNHSGLRSDTRNVLPLPNVLLTCIPAPIA